MHYNNKGKKSGQNKALLIAGVLFLAICLAASAAGGVYWYLLEKEKAQYLEDSYKDESTKTNMTEDEENDNSKENAAAYTDDTAQTYYSRILIEYQKAEQNGFAGEYEDFPYVNPVLLDSGERELYYTLENMSADGIPELIIAELTNQSDVGYKILDIYGYDDKTPQHLSVVQELGIRAFTGDGQSGSLTECSICGDGFFKFVQNSDSQNISTEYYSLTSGTANLNLETSLAYSEGYYFQGSSGGLEANELTAEQYESALSDWESQHPVRTDMDWKKLSDLSISEQEEENIPTFDVTTCERQPAHYPRTDFMVSSSSYLQKDGVEHPSSLMEDSDRTTYWADGRAGLGTGESFSYNSPFPQDIQGLYIEPGLAASAQDYQDNGRPLKLRFIFSNGLVGTADLSSFAYTEDSALYIDFGQTITVDSCKIIIEEAQSGEITDDTCISTMFFAGSPAEQ